MTIKMTNHWEQFAKTDPYFYIATKETTDDFWTSGESNFKKFILPILEKYKIENNFALDFGCGIGRYTFPLAKFFKNVLGADISESMIKLAKTEAKKRNYNNVQFVTNQELSQKNYQFDFVYSTNVFQHIESFKEIENIIKWMKERLSGFAYLHFDTRRKNLFSLLKPRLPNFILPKTQKTGIRRTRQNTQNLRALFNSLNFKITEEFNSDSEFHYFLIAINHEHETV